MMDRTWHLAWAGWQSPSGFTCTSFLLRVFSDGSVVIDCEVSERMRNREYGVRLWGQARCRVVRGGIGEARQVALQLHKEHFGGPTAPAKEE